MRRIILTLPETFDMNDEIRERIKQVLACDELMTCDIKNAKIDVKLEITPTLSGDSKWIKQEKRRTKN